MKEKTCVCILTLKRLHWHFGRNFTTHVLVSTSKNDSSDADSNSRAQTLRNGEGRESRVSAQQHLAGGYKSIRDDLPMTFSNSKTIDWRLAVFIKNSLQVTHRKGMKKKLMVFLYLKIFPWLKARPLSSLPTQHKYWFTNSLVCAASASSFFQSYEE